MGQIMKKQNHFPFLLLLLLAFSVNAFAQNGERRERTIDEMSHAWVNVTYITEDDYQSYLAKKKAEVASAAAPAP